MKHNIINNIINEAIENALNEYHEQYRIPFKEFGEGHAFIDEFIDWIQYSSKKGTLPKPKITWEEGIKKGCEEYAKKIGKEFDEVYESFINSDTFEEEALTFDENGNLYVERAINMSTPDGDLNDKDARLYGTLINKYEKNVGGCWAYKKGMANAYCGNGDIEVIFKGYMFLDDVFWSEFIRLELRGYDEKEIRTYPNGRVQLMEIVVDNKTLTTKSFDGPRILSSTFFGNNQIYGKSGFAKLGYQRIGYDNQFIDREGNEYKLTDYVQKSLQNGARPEEVFDYINDFENGFAVVTLNKKNNIVDSNYNIISPELWFDECDVFKKGFSAVQLNDKYNFINAEGKLLSPNLWFDTAQFFSDGFAVISLNGRYNFISTEGKLLSPNQWFDYCYYFNEGYASVVMEGRYNFIDTEGNLVSKNMWFDEAYTFHNGFATVRKRSKNNIINTEGNLISPDMWFDECYVFSEGFAKVILDSKENFIDANGNLLSPKQWFDYCESFKNGLGLVKLNNKGNWIKQDGSFLSPQWFEHCSTFRNGMAIVELNRVYNYIDTDGNILSPNFWFDVCYPFNGEYASVNVNEKWYQMDKQLNFYDYKGNRIPNPINNANESLTRLRGIIRHYINEAIRQF